MTAQSKNVRSIASKMASGVLEELENQTAKSIDDYIVVKRFADEFNSHAVPALREAGVVTRLRAVFKEEGTVCEIRKGGWLNDALVAKVNAYYIENVRDDVANKILDNLPIRDRERIQHNLPRILGVK